MGRIDRRLKDLGIDLPIAAKPVANYVPCVRTGNLIFVSGQVTFKDGKALYLGRLGETISLEQGAEAAKLCAINLLSQLKLACDGNLDKVTRIVKIVGFVNCGPSFTDMPKVVNGASDFFVEVFGEAGRHARSAVGSSSLPLGVAVELEAVVEVA